MEPVPLWGVFCVQFLFWGIVALLTLMEVAAESLNENRLERLADDGDAQAARMLRLMDQCAGALSTIRNGMVLVTLFSGAFLAHHLTIPIAACLSDLPWVSPSFPLRCFIAALLCLLCGYIMLVVGIVIPRKLAAAKTDGVLRAMFNALRLFNKLLRPFSQAVSGTANALLALFKFDANQSEEQVTEDEILAMVDIGEEKGAIERNEKEMIENIFEFNNLSAEDCMTHRTDISAIRLGSEDGEIVRQIEESGLSRFPVYDKDIDSIVGILTTRDYLLNARKDEPHKIADLVRPAYFVPESIRTDVLFREMQKRKTHMAIVVDEYGGTSGLITMEDLLEEIVGNIYDEFDPLAEQDIVPLADGRWRVAGSVELERLSEALGVELPDDDEFDTLGGLIFSQLTAIPGDGNHPEVDCFGLHIRVDQLVDRRVEWTTIEKTDSEEAE